MYVERMRQDWQHTAFATAYLLEVNRGKKGRPIKPEDLNPMEAGGKTKKSGGIPLNSPEGFQALYAISQQCQPRR